MARVKLTKTELKAQNDALRRFERFLPMLQLKKKQLQAEIAAITVKTEEVAAAENALRAEVSSWAGLVATAPEHVQGLVALRGVKTGSANIAGVTMPTYEGIDIDRREVDAWETPPWVDDAALAMERMIALREERAVYDTQLKLVSEELQLTSQRVNLFEKVKIPGCKEAIRVIKIALGDEQTAAVTRGKIAKSRSPQS